MAGEHVRYAPLYRAIRIVLVLMIAALIIWPFLEAKNIQIEQKTITSSSLPSAIGQLRVVYLSDIHATGFPFFSMDDMSGLVSKINSLNPDIVLLGGDYTADTEHTIDFFLKLPLIHSNYGVYAVLGEHDQTSTDSATMSRLRAAMVSAGVTPLINSVESVRIGRSDVFVVGMNSDQTDTNSLTALSSQVSQDDYVIFLAHNPSIISDALIATDSKGRINWYDLGLFGHTHNGQMIDIVNTLRRKAGSRSGWFTENKIPMLVSNGIGTTGIPARFLCSPTIHVITIKSGT